LTREERNKYNYWLIRRIINGIVEKQCSQCKEWKEDNLNNFYMINKKKPNLGFTPRCRKCGTKASVDRYAKSPERMKEYAITYRAEHIDKCISDIKQWRAEVQDHDHKREYEIQYYKKYPEKHKLYQQNHRQHDITEAEWRSCLKVFDNTCAYCGLPYKQHIVKRMGKYIIMNFHKEHSDDKGYNDLRNALPACKSCNSRKHDSDMEEWYRRQKFFSEERYNKIIWWLTDGYKDYIEDKPPYRIIREKNKDNAKFHFNLWSVDEMRNTLEIISTKDKRKDLEEDIEIFLKRKGG